LKRLLHQLGACKYVYSLCSISFHKVFSSNISFFPQIIIYFYPCFINNNYRDPFRFNFSILYIYHISLMYVHNKPLSKSMVFVTFNFRFRSKSTYLSDDIILRRTSVSDESSNTPSQSTPGKGCVCNPREPFRICLKPIVYSAQDRKSVRVGKECRSRWSPYH